MTPPTPWCLAPLKGKYYETVVVDASGDHVLAIWVKGDLPSPREDIAVEDICDSHYENVETFETAVAICNAVNEAADR